MSAATALFTRYLRVIYAELFFYVIFLFSPGVRDATGVDLTRKKKLSKKKMDRVIYVNYADSSATFIYYGVYNALLTRYLGPGAEVSTAKKTSCLATVLTGTMAPAAT